MVLTAKELETGWISLEKYCEITGEKTTTVHTRVYNKVWKRGVHFSTPDGGASYVNFKEVIEWAKNKSGQ